MTPATADRSISFLSMTDDRSSSPKPPLSFTKYIERQIIKSWKAISRSTRKSHRASFLPQDFVFVTSRRRSVFL